MWLEIKPCPIQTGVQSQSPSEGGEPHRELRTAALTSFPTLLKMRIMIFLSRGMIYVLCINVMTNIMLYTRGAKVHSDFVPRVDVILILFWLKF